MGRFWASSRALYFTLQGLIFLQKTWARGQFGQRRFPWQPWRFEMKYVSICSFPPRTCQHTKFQGGLWIFISNFVWLSHATPLNHCTNLQGNKNHKLTILSEHEPVESKHTSSKKKCKFSTDMMDALYQHYTY